MPIPTKQPVHSYAIACIILQKTSVDADQEAIKLFSFLSCLVQRKYLTYVPTSLHDLQSKHFHLTFKHIKEVVVSRCLNDPFSIACVAHFYHLKNEVFVDSKWLEFHCILLLPCSFDREVSRRPIIKCPFRGYRTSKSFIVCYNITLIKALLYFTLSSY